MKITNQDEIQCCPDGSTLFAGVIECCPSAARVLPEKTRQHESSTNHAASVLPDVQNKYMGSTCGA
jgi:hypothetical protein